MRHLGAAELPSDSEFPVPEQRRWHVHQGDPAASCTSDAGQAWAAAWGDYDNDGFLDLFVAQVEPKLGGNRLFHKMGYPLDASDPKI